MGKYDIVIIGAGLAGLSVAARMVRKGKRAVILDPATAVGGNAVDISLEGIRFSSGPSAVFGFEPGGPLRTLCSELGINLNLVPELKAYQVVLPDRRITVFPDKESTLDELRREFPHEIDSIRKLFRELRALFDTLGKNRMKAYLARRRKADDFLSSLRLSRELIAFFNVQSLMFFGIPVSDLRMDSLALLVSSFPQAERDGISGIVTSLGKIVSGSGGSIRMDEPWPEIIGRSNTITGVVTRTGVIETRSVLVNTMEPGTERRWLLGVRPDVIPVGMHGTVFCLLDYDNPDNIMTLSMPDNEAAEISEKHIRALRVSFYGSDHAAPSEILFDNICSVIPFLRDFIELGGEEDLSMLSYPAGKILVHHQAGGPGHTVAGACNRLKNIFFMPDRYTGVGQSVMETHRLLKRIS